MFKKNRTAALILAGVTAFGLTVTPVHIPLMGQIEAEAQTLSPVLAGGDFAELTKEVSGTSGSNNDSSVNINGKNICYKDDGTGFAIKLNVPGEKAEGTWYLYNAKTKKKAGKFSRTTQFGSDEEAEMIILSTYDKNGKGSGLTKGVSKDRVIKLMEGTVAPKSKAEKAFLSHYVQANPKYSYNLHLKGLKGFPAMIPGNNVKIKWNGKYYSKKTLKEKYEKALKGNNRYYAADKNGKHKSNIIKLPEFGNIR